jgi:hypothetical protein
VAECYAFLCSEDALDLGKVLAMVDAAGAAGLKAMKLLDEGEWTQPGEGPERSLRRRRRTRKGCAAAPG